MKAEAGWATNEKTASFLWDLSSFFDCIDHGLLLSRARKYDFPIILVKLALSTYTAARTIQVRECRAAQIFPRRGIVAGCTFAKALVHLY